jgi:outer membrane lipoprotein-sorting protein
MTAVIRRQSSLAFLLLLSAGVAVRATQSTAVGDWPQVVASYAAVTDYSGTYEKEERAISNGELQRMRLFFRKPLDVRLEWLDDGGGVDQIAVYRDGFNNGRLLVRRRGVFGSLLGTLRLDPNGSRAKEDSRHPITEIGIGYLIARVDQELRDRRLTVRSVVEELLEGAPADRFEFESATTGFAGVENARRAIAWVDRNLRLPVQVELLDARGTLVERHRFKSVRVNVGLTDSTFSL